MHTTALEEKMMSNKILLVNGPNLNMLGQREPEKYGNKNLKDILDFSRKMTEAEKFSLITFQSNSEGEIVDFIQKEGINSSGMLLNAGAYTHTSIAIRDAILSVQIPFIEIHLTNVFAREAFRRESYLSDIAIGVISGFGENSYYLGIRAIIDFIRKNN